MGRAREGQDPLANYRLEAEKGSVWRMIGIPLRKPRRARRPWLLPGLFLAVAACIAAGVFIKPILAFVGIAWPARGEPAKAPELRTIYLAPSRDYGPCKRAAVPRCANYYPEDAVIKLRLPTSLYRHHETVWSPLELQVYMDAATVRPAREMPPEALESERNLLRSPDPGAHVALDVSDRPAPAGKSSLRLLQERVNQNNQDDYVPAESWLPGFYMLDKRACLSFDRNLPERADPARRPAPLAGPCEQRVQFFAPRDDSTAQVSCVAWGKLKGDFAGKRCVVSDLYAGERIAHSFGVSALQVEDGSWREINRRLKGFILSYRVPG